jgi:LuxR family transcriptional regulator, maltose regulon positive regulatory protein
VGESPTGVRIVRRNAKTGPHPLQGEHEANLASSIIDTGHMIFPRPTECFAGDDALARGAWAGARAAYEAVLRDRETPEALEGLGIAAWWLDMADLVFECREGAYRLYLAREDRAAAARVAVWLAWDSWAFRGESAVANGWLQRARRLLENHPPCAERAWLEVREGSLCLLEEGDPERALSLAREGVRIAQEVGSIDLEMLGRAVEGLSLVTSGAVAEGMRKLDEVNTAVIAGELTDRVAIGLSGCYLIAACERVRDYGRATEWCRRLKEFCEKWGLRPLFAVCRTQYASICVWRGTWLEAEQELCAARDELAASRPAMRGDALVRLAQLRRRQGRLEEAAALVEQVPPHGAGLLERAELAFDCEDAQGALELVEQYLRHLPIPNRTDRAPGLELAVRARTERKNWPGAKAALDELAGIAGAVGNVPLRAAASFAAGYLAMGQGKTEDARHCFEDACDLYSRSEAPFETGRAQIQLARALGALGHVDAAVEQLRRAKELLSGLKAELELARAERAISGLLARQLADRPEQRGKPGGLTRREIEVLRLVAEGLSNQLIAERLFVSEHTIHRHLANILNKLDASTRAAAVAQAARLGLLA